jgi:predicted metalloenzyme YecM
MQIHELLWKEFGLSIVEAVSVQLDKSNEKEEQLANGRLGSSQKQIYITLHIHEYEQYVAVIERWRHESFF